MPVRPPFHSPPAPRPGRRDCSFSSKTCLWDRRGPAERQAAGGANGRAGAPVGGGYGAPGAPASGRGGGAEALAAGSAWAPRPRARGGPALEESNGARNRAEGGDSEFSQGVAGGPGNPQGEREMAEAGGAALENWTLFRKSGIQETDQKEK